jgi:hypothetical protein
VARIQQLANLRDKRRAVGQPDFEVIACIDGRGFGVRSGDMKKLLAATGGKVFTFKTLDRLVDNTSLKGFRSS